MKIKRVLLIILGILIVALSLNIFFIPYNIIPGGTSGLAIVFQKLFDLRIEITIIWFSLMSIILGYLLLNKKEVSPSLWSLILFPLFVYLTKYLLDYVNLTVDNKIVASISGGICLGFGMGLLYREGLFVGGVDLLGKIFEEYIPINFTVIIFILDSIIVIIGGFVFDFETIIYSFLAICFSWMMINKVILGINNNKSFYIITTKPKLVKKLIVDELGHGATILKGNGAYTNENKYIFFVSIPTRDYYKLRDGLKEIDQDAFFVASNSYEVAGGK